MGTSYPGTNTSQAVSSFPANALFDEYGIHFLVPRNERHSMLPRQSDILESGLSQKKLLWTGYVKKIFFNAQ